MTRGTLKSPNPRNRNSISVINSKFLSASSMNTLLAIFKFTDARRRRHTGRRTEPPISLETPSAPAPPPPLLPALIHSLIPLLTDITVISKITVGRNTKQGRTFHRKLQFECHSIRRLFIQLPLRKQTTLRSK